MPPMMPPVGESTMMPPMPDQMIYQNSIEGMMPPPTQQNIFYPQVSMPDTKPDEMPYIQGEMQQAQIYLKDPFSPPLQTV